MYKRQAREHHAYIAGETLATALRIDAASGTSNDAALASPPDPAPHGSAPEAHASATKIDGLELALSLRKAATP